MESEGKEKSGRFIFVIDFESGALELAVCRCLSLFPSLEQTPRWKASTERNDCVNWSKRHLEAVKVLEREQLPFPSVPSRCCCIERAFTPKLGAFTLCLYISGFLLIVIVVPIGACPDTCNVS